MAQLMGEMVVVHRSACASLSSRTPPEPGRHGTGDVELLIAGHNLGRGGPAAPACPTTVVVGVPTLHHEDLHGISFVDKSPEGCGLCSVYDPVGVIVDVDRSFGDDGYASYSPAPVPDLCRSFQKCVEDCPRGSRVGWPSPDEDRLYQQHIGWTGK